MDDVNKRIGSFIFESVKEMGRRNRQGKVHLILGESLCIVYEKHVGDSIGEKKEIELGVYDLQIVRDRELKEMEMLLYPNEAFYPLVNTAQSDREIVIGRPEVIRRYEFVFPQSSCSWCGAKGEGFIRSHVYKNMNEVFCSLGCMDDSYDEF